MGGMMRPDHKPKRCYVDDQGNTIDPRTSWDDLLKYYRKYRLLLGTGDFSRHCSSNTPLHALKLIIAENIHQKNKERASKMEKKDLKKKEKVHKRRSRNRQAELAADYLDKVHKQHS